MAMKTNILLAILFGAALTLAGAESEPWEPAYNVAGVALFVAAGFGLFWNDRRQSRKETTIKNSGGTK
jgi:hypothetical protein